MGATLPSYPWGAGLTALPAQSWAPQALAQSVLITLPPPPLLSLPPPAVLTKSFKLHTLPHGGLAEGGPGIRGAGESLAGAAKGSNDAL